MGGDAPSRTIRRVPSRVEKVEPPELARVLDFAERPRVDDWSLRAALTRYAQPEPQRVSDLLDVVRRIEFAVRAHQADLERHGPALWQTVRSPAAGDDSALVGLLRLMLELDRLGDVLAAWAVDPSQERPSAAVDEITAEAGARLDALGVPREERQPPARRRG